MRGPVHRGMGPRLFYNRRVWTDVILDSGASMGGRARGTSRPGLLVPAVRSESTATGKGAGEISGV